MPIEQLIRISSGRCEAQSRQPNAGHDARSKISRRCVGLSMRLGLRESQGVYHGLVSNAAEGLRHREIAARSELPVRRTAEHSAAVAAVHYFDPRWHAIMVLDIHARLCRFRKAAVDAISGNHRAAIRVTSCLQEVKKVSRSMNNPDDIHTLSNDAVQDEVVCHWVVTQAPSDVIASPTQLGMVSEKLALLLDPIEQLVRGAQVVPCNVKPNVFQVLLGGGA
jgi:hypothetical protein